MGMYLSSPLSLARSERQVERGRRHRNTFASTPSTAPRAMPATTPSPAATPRVHGGPLLLANESRVRKLGLKRRHLAVGLSSGYRILLA